MKRAKNQNKMVATSTSTDTAHGLSVRTPSSSSASSSSASTDAGTTMMSAGENNTSLPSPGSPRLVRFDERCILIPEKLSTGKLARIGRLELNIPVGFPWRWGGGSPSPRDKEFSGRSVTPTSAPDTDTGVDGIPVGSSPRSHEAQHVVLKVPYPIFRRKSHSTLQASVVCPRSCLRRSHSQIPHSATAATFNSHTNPDSMTPKRRFHSLPAFPADPNVETVPLRPCCENCLAACEVYSHHGGRKRLPTLEESSREHTPSHSRLNLIEIEDEEDWCASLHFTKGAYKLWRSASVDHHMPKHIQEGSASGLLGSLVCVDEADRKHSSSPSSSALTPNSSIHPRERDLPTLHLRDLERVKASSSLAPPRCNGNGNASPGSANSNSNDSEEDLFPLPSPKGSPSASPSDSVSNLPAQVSTDPSKLEAAIRAKIAEREREMRDGVATGPTSKTINDSGGSKSSPIAIRQAPSSKREAVGSRFQSNLDEIEWDPSVPDPDALPPGSSMLLDSPPGSPPLGPVASNGPASRERADANGRNKALFSASVPSLSAHSPEISITGKLRRASVSSSGGAASGPPPGYSSSSAASPPAPSVPPVPPLPNLPRHVSPPAPPAYSPSPSRPSPSSGPTRVYRIPVFADDVQPPREAARKRSFSSIMRASAGVLRGLALPVALPAAGVQQYG